MVTKRSPDMETAHALISRVDTRTAADEADPRSQRLDSVKNSDREQWPTNNPLLKIVEDAPAQAGKN
jgi:hypothetical protein